jgi:hypothetical protein
MNHLQWRILHSGIGRWVQERVADRALNKAIILARDHLRQTRPLNLLLDTSIYGNSVLCTTERNSFGNQLWAPHRFNAGQHVRKLRGFNNHEVRLRRDITVLPGINHLASEGLLTLYDTLELREERWNTKASRFLGVGWFDFSLKWNVTLLDTPFKPPVIGAFPNAETRKYALREFPKKRSDEPFCSIVIALKKEVRRRDVLQDAWHLHCAHMNRLDGMLVCDHKFADAMRAVRERGEVSSELPPVFTPSELGHRLNFSAPDLKRWVRATGCRLMASGDGPRH